ETRPLLHHVEPGARREDRCFDLQAVAHDAFVLKQAFDSFRRVARDLRRFEAVESAAKVLALAQDDDPGQAGLEAVEHEHLEQGAVVVYRQPPFVIVIGNVKLVMPSPWAARTSVRRVDFAHLYSRGVRTESLWARQARRRTAVSRRPSKLQCQ